MLKLSMAATIHNQLLQGGLREPAQYARPTSRSGPVYAESRRPSSSSPVREFMDDSEVIRRFFRWKIDRVLEETTQDNWEKAAEIVYAYSWSTKELKEMDDTESRPYSEAIAAEIKLPIARQFRRELAVYKRWARREVEGYRGSDEDARERENFESLTS